MVMGGGGAQYHVKQMMSLDALYNPRLIIVLK